MVEFAVDAVLFYLGVKGYVKLVLGLSLLIIIFLIRRCSRRCVLVQLLQTNISYVDASPVWRHSQHLKTNCIEPSWYVEQVLSFVNHAIDNSDTDSVKDGSVEPDLVGFSCRVENRVKPVNGKQVLSSRSEVYLLRHLLKIYIRVKINGLLHVGRNSNAMVREQSDNVNKLAYHWTVPSQYWICMSHRMFKTLVRNWKIGILEKIVPQSVERSVVELRRDCADGENEPQKHFSNRILI